jgi:hypothetical protein
VTAYVQLQEGDRVRLKHEDELGTIHAIWDGAEDTIEVRLDSGRFTCCDAPHLELVQFEALFPKRRLTWWRKLLRSTVGRFISHG